MKTLLNNRILTGGLILVVGIFLGWIFFAPTSHDQPALESHEHDVSEVWTCSMHPSIRQPEPGKCPICGMDLIPLQSDDDGTDPLEVKMSPTAIKLANIQTMIVSTDNAARQLRLNGKVQPDERNVFSQSAHIPGRIERLLVNVTGEEVRKGAVIAYVYSPELVTAQQELFEANKIKESQPALYRAAREKLKNWKLSDKQIDEMLMAGKPKEQLPIVADASGIVMSRNVSVGDYVERGASIYDLVDLSRVWVLFDVYENDMTWVRKGNLVEFTVQSLPGKAFNGKVTFIDPVVNPATRVSTARVEISNPKQELKPEMFVTGVVQSNLKGSNEIVIPKSAVMWTGERSIVYLKKTSDAGISFKLQEVVLGPSLGESYVIKEGLESGAEIVVNGTFTIDAAAQLAGKPSMMNPEGGEPATGHQHGGGKEITATAEHKKAEGKVSETFKKQLIGLLDSYLSFKDALVNTDASAAAKGATMFSSALSKVDMKALDPATHDVWMPLYMEMKKAADTAASDTDIELQRELFSVVTDSYYKAIQTFDVTGLHSFYQYCPMAFGDKGAFWISKDENIRNPYFGSKMMRCGETRERIN